MCCFWHVKAIQPSSAYILSVCVCVTTFQVWHRTWTTTTKSCRDRTASGVKVRRLFIWFDFLENIKKFIINSFHRKKKEDREVYCEINIGSGLLFSLVKCIHHNSPGHIIRSLSLDWFTTLSSPYYILMVHYNNHKKKRKKKLIQKNSRIFPFFWDQRFFFLPNGISPTLRGKRNPKMSFFFFFILFKINFFFSNFKLFFFFSFIKKYFFFKEEEEGHDVSPK